MGKDTEGQVHPSCVEPGHTHSELGLLQEFLLFLSLNPTLPLLALCTC